MVALREIDTNAVIVRRFSLTKIENAAVTKLFFPYMGRSRAFFCT